MPELLQVIFALLSWLSEKRCCGECPHFICQTPLYGTHPCGTRKPQLQRLTIYGATIVGGQEAVSCRACVQYLLHSFLSSENYKIFIFLSFKLRYLDSHQ